MLKDLLQYTDYLEKFYNESAIEIRNPEARQLFIQHRDEYLRDVAKLQQKIERVESKPRIISRLLPSKTR